MLKRRGGLRARIIAWTFVPTMVILGAVALYAYLTYERVTETLVMERNRKLTELLAAQMSVEITGHIDALNALAMTADLQSLEPAHVRTALQWWVGTLRDFDAGVLVLDANGKVIAADPRALAMIGEDWSQRRFFQRILTQDTVPFFSDVEPLAPDGRPSVAAVLPLGGGGANLRGVIVGLFELYTPLRRTSALYRSMARFQTRPDETRAYLVDSAGRLIDPRRELAAGQDVSSWPPVVAGLAQVGSMRTTGLGGEEVVVSYAPVPDTPWTLFEEEDWAAVMAQSRAYGRVLLALLLAGLALPPLLLAFGLRRVLRPVEAMTVAAQRIASAGDDAIVAGALEQTVTAAADDELADLAEAFNAMAARLRAVYGSLERQVADRTHELTALNGVTQAVNASLDLRETLSVALDRTLDALGGSAGLIYTARAGGGRRELVAHGVDPNTEAAVRRAVDSGKTPSVPSGVIGVPLEAQGEIVGSLWIWPRAGEPVGDSVPQLLRAIGQGVGVAAENARLYAEVEREAVVSERTRIARELHDSVTQTLFSANLIAGVLPVLWENSPEAGRERLAELRELTQGALAEMRMLLLELRPAALEAASLRDLLGQLRAAVAARARLPVTLDIDGDEALPAPVRLALYRVAQEALNNAVNHAEAETLAIELALWDGARLTVRDDGRGFDPERAPHDRLGLSGMRERMAAVGGSLQIESRPGGGTMIVASWNADRED